MQIVQLPKSLNDVTLEQWVNWNNIYGKDLMAKARAAEGDEDKMLLFETEFALKHYAHYSNTPTVDIDELLVSDKDAVVEIIKEASLSQAMMFREMCDIPNIDFKNIEFDFYGYKWRIVPPVHIEANTKLTVEQFEKCQDISLILSRLQDAEVEALYELCIEYLQTVAGKHMTTVLISGDVPLYVALCVKAYTIQTINLLNQLSHDRAAAIT